MRYSPVWRDAKFGFQTITGYSIVPGVIVEHATPNAREWVAGFALRSGTDRTRARCQACPSLLLSAKVFRALLHDAQGHPVRQQLDERLDHAVYTPGDEDGFAAFDGVCALAR